MKFTSYLCLLSSISLGFSSPIPLSDINTDGLQAEDLTPSFLLQQELSSVLLSETNVNAKMLSSSRVLKESDDILVIPKNQLFEKSLNSLGLKDLVRYSKKFKLQNLNRDTDLEILIPEGATPFFIFNSTNSLQLPQEQSRSEYTKFIEQSAPFRIPEFSSLIDYFLVLPIPENFKHSKQFINKLNNGVITLSSEKLPLFKHEFSRSNSPLMVFLFKSGEDAIENNELNVPLMNTKGPIGAEGLNQFFDFFATTWAKDISFSQLVHGVFCTLNVDFIAQSYCIKVKEDLSNLALFPVYSRDQRKLEKREKVSRLGKHIIGKYSDSEVDIEDNGLNIPTTILKGEVSLTTPESVDSDSFEVYRPRGKGYSQVVSKLKSVAKPKVLHDSTSQLDKRSINDAMITSDNVKDIQDKLHQRLRTKKIKDKKIRENGNTFVVSKLNDPHTGNTGESQRSKINVAKSNKNSNSFEIYDAKKSELNLNENNVNSKIHSPISESTPKSRNSGKKNPVKLTSHRSQGEKPEELFLTSEKQRGAKTSDFSQQGCAPVTWYNVFHHSVFGKTKFCGIDA
ncbi:hypothetical protein WICPIJ_003354 [Wickerhamomyces pijperi]|uniref:Secreted protein n=1 Tax=Wickerhamomyces pijperi TaxID=599730 RepID=A0A9P8TNY5_WICPI|nr:hypothetical protein WICPIJ_003354 [Wickerhamomyces pijperi]